MWAYQLIEPRTFALVTAPTPHAEDLADGDVLLHLLAGGVCGSDVPKFTGAAGGFADGGAAVGYPMHEVVGEVLASRDPTVAVGSRVVGWANHSDGLREYVVTRGQDVHPVDAAFAATDAVLIQPLACVLEALDRVALRGRSVAVLGLGPIGLLFAHAAKRAGASRVTGVDPVDRSAVARRLSIDTLVTSPSRAWARALAGPDRPDVVVEAVGHQVSTLDDAIVAVAECGEIYYFGIPDDDVYPVNMRRLLRKNVTLRAGVTRDRRRALGRAHAYLERHPELADVLITHRLGRRQVQAAYGEAAIATSHRLKVVLSFAD